MVHSEDGISVILPTYNEEENIVRLIEELLTEIESPVEIIVVDDNSEDGTADIVEALRNPNIVLIRRKERGLASAFNRGIIESKYGIVCWMDADMSMPAHVLAKMIKCLDCHDMAIGSRYVEGGSDDRSPLRVLSSRLINGFARLVLGGHVRDYDSGFVALRRKVFDTVTVIPFGYGEYFMELVYDAQRKGLSLVEVGYSFKDRTVGYSKSFPSLLTFIKTGMHYIFRIITIRIRFLRGGS